MRTLCEYLHIFVNCSTLNGFKLKTFISGYFDRWVCETACQVGENAISDRLFSALCTHRMRVAFTGWHQVTITSLAAKGVQKNYMRRYTCLVVCNMQAFVSILTFYFSVDLKIQAQ